MEPHVVRSTLTGRKDAIIGVSECIIMGIPIPIGTGLFKVNIQHAHMYIYTVNCLESLARIISTAVAS